jgi:ADP-heptose:LPS heptosyltransferase
VQPQLVRLVVGMPGLPGATRVVARGGALPRFDCHCPLLSLPLAFATDLTNIPANVPYLVPADADVAAWRARLPPPRGRLRIGIAWSGARAHDNDVNRSLRLATLVPLFDLAGVDFVCLQHEVREEDVALLHSHDDIVRIGPDFRDFADTAAALASLDAVIAVDTALAHLAGAMGKPLYLLLPFAADFRWLRERGDSRWYPSARLFRQPRFGDWDGAIGALRAALLAFIRSADVAT